MRRAIPVEKRVAMGIFTLAHKPSYAVTSALFGAGIATVREIVVEFAQAMEKLLLSWTMYLGNAHQIMDAFRRRGFPQVVGLMDGCHCLIIPPLGQRSMFVSRKGSYSVILQGTCDHTGRFVDMELRWPESAHDARVAKNSVIFEAMEAGIYVEGNPNINIRGPAPAAAATATATTEEEEPGLSRHLPGARDMALDAMDQLLQAWQQEHQMEQRLSAAEEVVQKLEERLEAIEQTMQEILRRLPAPPPLPPP
ncbi:putative nuclease HARBI1 isoform X3 [Sceloporus undulatus]|nr:putative nuclease HARBI1 isoform X3 [Sceloporus undulatus]